MILSNITDFHFQSLLPCEDNVIDFVMADNALPRSTINKESTRKRTNNSTFSSRDKKSLVLTLTKRKTEQSTNI